MLGLELLCNEIATSSRLEHGYYERLLNVQRLNWQLWEVLRPRVFLDT